MTSTLLTTAYNAAEDKKALDIIVLNMEGISVMADQFIICHGNSERQVQTIAREVLDQATEAGYPVKRMEGFESGRWILVDLGDVVIHVFHKDERGHYNLEKLWGRRTDIGYGRRTMNRSYTEFATVYDELMTDIPYSRYVELIELAADGIAGKKILDIGCGTGLLSVQLAKKGGLVTGIDLSPAMLAVAEQRAANLTLPIKFIQQPMQRLSGFSNIDVAVIAIDSLNYVIEREEVQQTFRNIYDALATGGVLLFDVHSTFKTDVIFQESPFTFDDGQIAYIWNTEKGEHLHAVYSELAFFVREKNGLYTRFDEVHYQRTFSVHEYVDLFTSVGFSIERIFADWEDEPPSEESERIFFQVRK